MSQYNETEIKLYVPDLQAVAEALRAAGAVQETERVYERNVRYDDAERSLTPRGMVIRLREDQRIRLTYKDDGVVTNGINSRFEAEVEVSDFNTMEMILGKLGFTPYMIYEKYRTTFTLDGTEIVLDELPYGNFVEIEGTVEQIEAVIARLGLGSAARQTGSYARLFERIRSKRGFTFTDLTFANFAGQTITPADWS
jgi:adenylate cyclase, class 2